MALSIGVITSIDRAPAVIKKWIALVDVMGMGAYGKHLYDEKNKINTLLKFCCKCSENLLQSYMY